MSVLKAGETVNAKRPIEDLADRLPSSKMNELERINEAGQKKDHAGQLKLLESLRKDISSDASDPKNDTGARENLKRALESINLMRGTAQEQMRGIHNDAAVTVSNNVAAIPPAIGTQLKQINDIAMSAKLTGPQAEQVATFLSRVEVCAKRGVFDMIPRFSDQFAKEMRESNAKEPNPALGRLAACGDNVGAVSKDLSQKIKSGIDISAQAPRNDTVEGPAHGVQQQARSTMGNFLMEKLKGQGPGPEKKRTLGLN
jgi:hypothetical protein